MVDVQVGVVTAEPLLACIDHRLGEGANNAIAISVPGPLEGQFVQIEVGEVGLRLGGRRGTKTLVVLDRVACRGRALFFAPSLVLVECEERDRVPALSCFYQRRHKLAQEVVLLQESGPVAVQEVDDQALDVRAIMVLISHDHELAVAKALDASLVLVGLALLQSNDLLEFRHLLVVHDCAVACIAHVQQLAAQRENAVVVSAYDRKASYGERLG
mmetsp:Transcript_5170/g.16442  ORF Transcript_5170/g.16442 Transcript_5170/m.16442 type:complete len:215 (+) Transcript_5170:469-1113(+)